MFPSVPLDPSGSLRLLAMASTLRGFRLGSSEKHSGSSIRPHCLQLLTNVGPLSRPSRASRTARSLGACTWTPTAVFTQTRPEHRWMPAYGVQVPHRVESQQPVSYGGGMPPIDRILAAYEQGLTRLADDLIAQNNPPEEDRAHLMLLSRLLQAVVGTYKSHQLDQAATLQVAGSVLAAAGAQERRVLNVSLRRLVDDNLMTPWYARFLNSSLQLKRTILITGGTGVGKSTLLNALIDLLPRDHRIVAIDEVGRGSAGAARPLFHGAAQSQARHARPSGSVPQGGRHETHLGGGRRSGAARRPGVSGRAQCWCHRRADHGPEPGPRGHAERLAGTQQGQLPSNSRSSTRSWCIWAATKTAVPGWRGSSRSPPTEATW